MKCSLGHKDEVPRVLKELKCVSGLSYPYPPLDFKAVWNGYFGPFDLYKKKVIVKVSEYYFEEEKKKTIL